MKKSTLIMILSLVLAVAIGIGSTMAYLQDTDEDVNVMTLGKVTITQNEQEWNEDGTKLQEFTQDKPLFPAVGTLAWKNTEYENGAYRQLDMQNVVDKYVTVTNTGKSDAYVRTLIAFEMGDYYYEDEDPEADDFDKLIGLNMNKADGAEFDFPGTWEWNYIGDYAMYVADVNAFDYFAVFEVVHQDPIAPGETTIPSLNQVYLVSEATNENIETIDVNKNGKYDILVLSQAVQTQGFASAEEALDTAFGPSVDNFQGWFDNIGGNIGTPGDKWPENNPPRFDEATIVSGYEDFQAALANGDDLIYMEAGIYAINGNGGESEYSIPEGTTIVGMGEVTIEGKLIGDLEDVSISNVTFSANSTVREVNPKGNVVFNRCYFDSYGGGWAVHFGHNNMDGNVTFNNCTIKGRVSMTGGSGHVNFRDCEFISNTMLGLLRTYGNATVENSTFDYSNMPEAMESTVGIEAVDNGIIELINCTNLAGDIEDLIHETNGGTVIVK